MKKKKKPRKHYKIYLHAVMSQALFCADQIFSTVCSCLEWSQAAF